MNSSTAPGFGESIQKIIADRGIAEVLHFTTNRGLVGILHSGAVLPRDELEVESYIENVRTLNCADRLKDNDWVSYVNMSITRVNGKMLGISKKWHEDDAVWWVVLAFDSAILTDPGVYFTTTNNVYQKVVRRSTGGAGLEDMFSDVVPWGHYGSNRSRVNSMPSNQTTDVQAEVLYPGKVSIERLSAIYVAEEEYIDQTHAILSTLPTPLRLSVSCKPEIFQ